MFGFLSSTPKILGAKKRHSSSGCAVTIKRFFASWSAGGKSLASLPTTYASNICNRTGAIRITRAMRRSSRQVRRETLLSLLASLGEARWISWVHM